MKNLFLTLSLMCVLRFSQITHKLKIGSQDTENWIHCSRRFRYKTQYLIEYCSRQIFVIKTQYQFNKYTAQVFGFCKTQ